jgi:methyltransferase (TIGR00027 family)
MEVSDTARWVAHLRGQETLLFRDPYACALAGDRGREIADTIPALPWLRADGMATNLAIRTRVFDELIMENITALEADAVLNLAAGLDARPYRLQLPPSLAWIEADCAALLEHKARVLAEVEPRCKVLRIATDLRAPDALLERMRSYRRVLVVSEGLLVYLDEASVRSLSQALASVPCLQRWIVESVAPRQIAAHMKYWGEALGDARWKFGADATFFRSDGWSLIETRSFFSESRRLERSGLRHPRLLRALSRCSSRCRRSLERAVVYSVLARENSELGRSVTDSARVT